MGGGQRDRERWVRKGAWVPAYPARRHGHLPAPHWSWGARVPARSCSPPGGTCRRGDRSALPRSRRGHSGRGRTTSRASGSPRPPSCSGSRAWCPPCGPGRPGTGRALRCSARSSAWCGRARGASLAPRSGHLQGAPAALRCAALPLPLSALCPACLPRTLHPAGLVPRGWPDRLSPANPRDRSRSPPPPPEAQERPESAPAVEIRPRLPPKLRDAGTHRALAEEARRTAARPGGRCDCPRATRPLARALAPGDRREKRHVGDQL